MTAGDGLTNQLADALAAEVANLSGLVAIASTPVDTVPGTPFFYVGPPKLPTIIGGSYEQLEYRFTLHYMVARVSGEDRDQRATNNGMDNVIAAFRSGITLGGLAASALLLSADTDKFYSVNATDYQSVDFEVQVLVFSPQDYTA